MKIKNIIEKLGLSNSVIAVTFCTLLMTLGLTFIFIHFLDTPPLTTADVYFLATLLPLIITPILSHIVFKILFSAHDQEAKMRKIAHTDSLSGLLTRRAWFQFAESYLSIAQRQRHSFVILMLDLDNFKAINDTFGHLAGDRVIISLGEIAKKIARESDIVSRFGGEEFAFLLANTDTEQAYNLCERLQHEIRNTALKYEDNDITFTASIGLAAYTQEQPFSIDQLLSLADKALYSAKARGKNCSVVYRET
jgi:diguanylate cyclase (GGDEF)-like protein